MAAIKPLKLFGGRLQQAATGDTVAVENGGTGTSTVFTAGSIVFAGTSGAYAQNNAGIFWDNINHRLGIGSASPTYAVDVTTTGANYLSIVGNGVSAASGFFRVTNGTGNAGIMNPIFWGKSNATGYQGLWFLGDTTTDTGSTEVVRFEARLNGVGVLSTRPLFDFANYTSSKMRMLANGNLGIGTTAPTAVIHIKAGTAAAGTAPLKFTSGTLLTTAEPGVVEYNNGFFVTQSDSVRRPVVLSNRATSPSAITVGSSPYLYQNTSVADEAILSKKVRKKRF